MLIQNKSNADPQDLQTRRDLSPQDEGFFKDMAPMKNEVMGRWQFKTDRGSSLVGLQATKKWCKGPDRKYHWYVRIGGRWELDMERDTA